MQFDMNLSLGFILNRTSIQSKALFTQRIKQFDISPEQWSLVFRTVESKGLTQKELSDSTYKDQANITRSIDRLEKKSLLKRVPNHNDRRIINIFPTEDAINLVDTIIPISSEFNSFLTKDFSEEEKQQLIKLLNKVYENLLKEELNETKNKIVLITGANGGLGQSFINYCLEQNVQKIYCCARDINKLNINDSRIEIIKLDITNLLDIDNLVKSIDYIDILINNAGVNSGKRIFEDISNDFEINVFGTLNIYKALYSKIKENGSIITINSILAFMNLPIMAQYCASKSALHSITQAIRAELKSKSIEVFEVFPGPMDTEMSKNLQMDKATPLQVVLNTFDGLTNKDFEIFPDDYSKNIISMVKNNSKKLEQQFACSIQQ